jgi:hypothetical protein
MPTTLTMTVYHHSRKFLWSDVFVLGKLQQSCLSSNVTHKQIILVVGTVSRSATFGANLTNFFNSKLNQLRPASEGSDDLVLYDKAIMKTRGRLYGQLERSRKAM